MLSVVAIPEKQRAATVWSLVETIIYTFIFERKLEADIDVRNRSIAGFDDGAFRVALSCHPIRLAQPLQFFTQRLAFLLHGFHLARTSDVVPPRTRPRDLLGYKAHISDQRAIH